MKAARQAAQTIQAALAALFGVQSRKAAQRAKKPWQLLLAGLGAALLLVLLLLMLANWLVRQQQDHEAGVRPASRMLEKPAAPPAPGSGQGPAQRVILQISDVLRSFHYIFPGLAAKKGSRAVFQPPASASGVQP